MTHAPGSFCWLELGTTDKAAAVAFYCTLFDWDMKDHPMGDHGVYTMAQKDGKDVCGMYTMMEEQQASGVPPHWLSYVAVSEIKAATDKAAELGATVLMGPMDVMGEGRMSLLQSPTGEKIALWEALKDGGSGAQNVVGTVGWTELCTRDRERAISFYTGLFGWTAETNEWAGTMYTSVKHASGQPVAGMLTMTPEMGEMPSVWMSYIVVDDCDAKAQQAAELGAQIFVQPRDIEGVGRFASMQDPQGACFSIIQFSGEMPQS